MGDVFILGAGFSRAISDAMPLLVDLSQEVRDRVQIPESGALFADNIEMWLTYLSQNHPWLSEADNLHNRASFLDLSHAVGAVLNERMGKVIQEKCPDWLIRLVQCWDEKKASVVTLNYDILVEKTAVTAIQRRCVDIYPITLTPPLIYVWPYERIHKGPSFQLFKLHGSVNWFYSGSGSFYGEIIYYVSVSGWPPSDDDLEREKSDTKAVADKVSLIIPPLMEKVPYFQHETLRSLWAQAGIALRGATRVFCLGYSLPETDITMRFFLHDNCPQSRVKFYLVNRNASIADHFRSLLPDCYEIDDRFVCPDAIPKLTDAWVGGNLD